MDLWSEIRRSEAGQTSQASYRTLPSKMSRTSSDNKLPAGGNTTLRQILQHLVKRSHSWRRPRLPLQTVFPPVERHLGLFALFESIIFARKGEMQPLTGLPAPANNSSFFTISTEELNRVTVLRCKTPRYNRGKSDDPGNRATYSAKRRQPKWLERDGETGQGRK